MYNDKAWILYIVFLGTGIIAHFIIPQFAGFLLGIGCGVALLNLINAIKDKEI